MNYNIACNKYKKSQKRIKKMKSILFPFLVNIICASTNLALSANNLSEMFKRITPITSSFFLFRFMGSLHTMRPILLQGHVSAEIEPKKYGV